MSKANTREEKSETKEEILKHDPKNKLALADLRDRARYFATGNLDIWAIRHINEEYSK